LRSSQFSTSKGINWITASLFLIADMAGGGVVALPIAMLNTGMLYSFFQNINLKKNIFLVKSIF
jgi:hypothetical protein